METTYQEWVLCLYVAGMTPAAKRAKANILAICEEHLAGNYSLEVIDLFERPDLAEGRQIVAVPTLVRKLPPPLRKIIGDLSNLEKVVWGLDILPKPV
jgi:circadian clock protein KaiB